MLTGNCRSLCDQALTLTYFYRFDKSKFPKGHEYIPEKKINLSYMNSNALSGCQITVVKTQPTFYVASIVADGNEAGKNEKVDYVHIPATTFIEKKQLVYFFPIRL